jgi:hypothetical protein
MQWDIQEMPLRRAMQHENAFSKDIVGENV